MGNWKLHEYFEDGALELYNLAIDPGESHDLSSALPDKTADMRALMEAWRERVGAPVPRELNPDYEADFRPR